jgi:UDP-2,3-diacylglucosamine hydrolase
MTSTTTYVTSDVHLGAVPEETRRAFHAWLEWAAGTGGRILINGDLFDFWFEYGHVIPRGHTRTLGLLARIVDAGVPVHLTGGNHDWWTGSFLGDEIGLELHPDPFRIELSGYDCLVAHGDGLGSGDLGYRMLRRVLRSRVSRWAFRWLHPDVGAMAARGASGTKHRQQHDLAPGSDRARELERWAREQLLDDETLDAVVLGHTHLPRRVEIAPGRFYLNAGDWLRHHSFLTLEQGKAPRLARWDGTGPAAIEQAFAVEKPPT